MLGEQGIEVNRDYLMIVNRKQAFLDYLSQNLRLDITKILQ